MSNEEKDKGDEGRKVMQDSELVGTDEIKQNENHGQESSDSENMCKYFYYVEKKLIK